MNNFWNEYPAIKKDLEAVEAILRKNAVCREKIIEESILEMINSGGKMLRPAFLMLSGKFGNYNLDKLHDLAAVVEMLHMATLIHDDIIDNSQFRRGQETVQSRHGQNYAVFIGDFLFTKCFMLLSNDSNMENMKYLSQVISRICVGEIEQYSSHYRVDSTVKQYLKRIAAKTAALFSLSFFVGALESECEKELCKTLGRIGYEIGMAFQIIDDILDYTGNEDLVGKPLANDLKQGIFTLPLIYALKTENSELKGLIIKHDYTEDEIGRIIELTIELGGLERARALAKRYTERAFNRINSLPECESKEVILDITQKLLLRNY